MNGVDMTPAAWLWVGVIVAGLFGFVYATCLATIGVYLLYAWYPVAATVLTALIVGGIFLHLYMRRQP